MNQNWQFKQFLKEVSETDFETNTTATGTVTIQQSARNALRKRGVEAFKADLMEIYGDEFDVLETKDGLVLVAENEPGEWTFSWELKSTIKSLDYDPFIEANNYDEEVASKQEKNLRREQEKEAKLKLLEEKRAKKLAEIEFFIHKFVVAEITCLFQTRIIFVNIADRPGRSTGIVVGKSGKFQALFNVARKYIRVLAVHVRAALNTFIGLPVDIFVRIAVAFCYAHFYLRKKVGINQFLQR